MEENNSPLALAVSRVDDELKKVFPHLSYRTGMDMFRANKLYTQKLDVLAGELGGE